MNKRDFALSYLSEAQQPAFSSADTYVIWPANPMIITQKTKKNIELACRYINQFGIPPQNVLVYCPMNGVSGNWGVNSVDEFLHTTIGVQSRLPLAEYRTITSIKTFALNIKQLEQKPLNAEQNGQAQSGRTTAVAKNDIKVLCQPMYNNDFLSLRNMGISVTLENIIKLEDDTEALGKGKQIYKDILEFNSKAKDKGSVKKDVNTMQKAASDREQRNKENIKESTLLHEDEQKQLASGGRTDEWSWNNIKSQKGALDFLNMVFSDIKICNENLASSGSISAQARKSVIKGVAADYLGEWADAGAEVGNLALESIGLGFMNSAIKKAAEIQKENRNRTDSNEVNNIKLFLDSKYSDSLIKNLMKPSQYIEMRG